MILDALAELETGVAFDLEAVRPAPGKPIRMVYIDEGGTSPLTITDGATNAAADAHMTIAFGANEQLAFDLPVDTQQFIKSTFTGKLFVVMDDQSNW